MISVVFPMLLMNEGDPSFIERAVASGEWWIIAFTWKWLLEVTLMRCDLNGFLSSFAFCLVEWMPCLEYWRNLFCFMSCWLTAGGIRCALCLVDWLLCLWMLLSGVPCLLYAFCFWIVHERLFILLLFDETFWSDLAERLFLPFIMPFGVLGLGWL